MLMISFSLSISLFFFGKLQFLEFVRAIDGKFSNYDYDCKHPLSIKASSLLSNSYVISFSFFPSFLLPRIFSSLMAIHDR